MSAEEFFSVAAGCPVDSSQRKVDILVEKHSLQFYLFFSDWSHWRQKKLNHNFWCCLWEFSESDILRGREKIVCFFLFFSCRIPVHEPGSSIDYVEGKKVNTWIPCTTHRCTRCQYHITLVPFVICDWIHARLDLRWCWSVSSFSPHTLPQQIQVLLVSIQFQSPHPVPTNAAGAAGQQKTTRKPFWSFPPIVQVKALWKIHCWICIDDQ